jgi:3'-5' exoribonuclease 1
MTGEGSMQGSRLEQLDTFHTYVRPTWKPILTEFCSTLTGITQVSYYCRLREHS